VLYFVARTALFRSSIRGGPAELIYQASRPLASPAVSPDGRWILLVQAGDPCDQLLVVAADGSRAGVLVEDWNFLMQPAWHPGGTRIAWVAWNHPFMPWQESTLCVADLSFASSLPAESQRFVLDPELAGRAVFQPSFSCDGEFLGLVGEAEAWANLAVLRNSGLSLHCRLQDRAEHWLPAWTQGLTTYGWSGDGKKLYFIRQRGGCSGLAEADPASAAWRPIAGEIDRFTSLRQPSVSPSGDGIALIASSPDSPDSVIVASSQGRIRLLHSSNPIPHDKPEVSPQEVHWKDNGVECHGIFTAPPPPFDRDAGQPALIKVHGGPTSASTASYNLENDFFTSRGYAVLELNYRGSTGYGRSYRQALDGQWGVADVEDVRSAALWLVRERLADPRRLVLSGGSSGGLTVLLALIRYPGIFGACLCRYPVTDLQAICRETHKFEKYYLESLVGPLPRYEAVYRQRSPLLHAGAIRDPIAVFQGEDDRVVPRSQTDQLAEALSRNGTPFLYHVFPGEGHGWRRPETILAYCRMVEEFLDRHLGALNTPAVRSTPGAPASRPQQASR